MTKLERQTLFGTLCASNDIHFTTSDGTSVSMDSVIDCLDHIGFFTQPASTRFHGVYEGGLFDHSLQVTKELIKLTDSLHLQWSRKGSPVIIGMFHDLCKTDLYEVKSLQQDGDKMCVEYKHSETPSLWGPGHGSKSVLIASTIIQLTPEEVACIRYHMGAYEKDEWDNLDVAIRRFNNVLWTHTADMMASKFYNT